MAKNLWVGVWDLHYPKHHVPTWNAVMDFVQSNPDKIAGFYFGGDQLDNEEISHHSKSQPILRPTGSYHKNTAGFDGKILKPLEAALDPDVPRIWQIGNHDDWEYQLVAHSPELQGTIERPGLLKLTDRKWEVLPLGIGYQLGQATLLHGEALTGIGNQASVYHAKRAVESYCSSVIYGHVHSLQSYTKVMPFNTKRKWIGVCSPAACSLNPGYLKNRPTAWINGFTIIELHDPGNPNSNFNVYPIVVSDGRFSFGGVTYGATT